MAVYRGSQTSTPSGTGTTSPYTTPWGLADFQDAVDDLGDVSALGDSCYLYAPSQGKLVMDTSFQSDGGTSSALNALQGRLVDIPEGDFIAEVWLQVSWKKADGTPQTGNNSRGSSGALELIGAFLDGTGPLSTTDWYGVGRYHSNAPSAFASTVYNYDNNGANHWGDLRSFSSARQSNTNDISIRAGASVRFVWRRTGTSLETWMGSTGLRPLRKDTVGTTAGRIAIRCQRYLSETDAWVLGIRGGLLAAMPHPSE